MRRQTEFWMGPIDLDRARDKPLYVQLCDRIANSIRRGELSGDARLPSTRMMARLLGVSRNTILMAYEALVAEGLLCGKRGSGTHVSSRSRAAGLRSIGLRRVIREARYPAHVLEIADRDGNAIHLNF
ncbi:MAG: GntR family transcriptional regulator [Acidobacteriaceae bacterium]|nr:GntR family transcriptional regulator [Acidobacteriaceae bacterium]